MISITAVIDDRDQGRRAEAAGRRRPSRGSGVPRMRLSSPLSRWMREAAGHVHELGDDDPVGEDARQEERSRRGCRRSSWILPPLFSAPKSSRSMIGMPKEKNARVRLRQKARCS